MSDAATLLDRCDRLGRCSEEESRLTRRFATPALAEARELVAEWMHAAGMATTVDAVGNLMGRYEGLEPDAPALALGSHLDTVPDAGRYDGPLGILAGLATVERLVADGTRLPFAVEVVAFADEEGARFRTAYLGSGAFCGRFDPAWLALMDSEGVSVAEAIRTGGGDPDAIAACARPAGSLVGWVEAHIEQGPVLEDEGLPVGVVTAIAAQTRLCLDFMGQAGHAGTTPMALRHDALAAAAETVLAVEVVGRTTEGVVATVGTIAVEPGAGNVIPGRATLSIDVRHADDATRDAAVTAILAQAEVAAATRGVSLAGEAVQEHGGVAMSPALTEALAAAVAAQGLKVCRLVSGAGHDAVQLAQLTPVAMLFVRCAGGLSHNPAEAVAEADIAVCLDVLERLVRSLA